MTRLYGDLIGCTTRNILVTFADTSNWSEKNARRSAPSYSSEKNYLYIHALLLNKIL